MPPSSKVLQHVLNSKHTNSLNYIKGAIQTLKLKSMSKQVSE